MISAAKVLAVSLAATAFIAGCERTAEPETSAPTTATSPAPSTEAADLCEVAAPILVAVPRSFIGSDEHVAQFDALAEVAPDDLAGDVALMRDHYANDVSPANPDSQDFKNFPAPIQEAALRLQGELTALCP